MPADEASRTEELALGAALHLQNAGRGPEPRVDRRLRPNPARTSLASSRRRSVKGTQRWMSAQSSGPRASLPGGDAQPFPNPPQALRDGDGRIRFKFGFHLEIDGRGFRTYRYR